MLNVMHNSNSNLLQNSKRLITTVTRTILFESPVHLHLNKNKNKMSLFKKKEKKKEKRQKYIWRVTTQCF